MTTRFVAIPTARLLDELRDIGGRVVGSAVAETYVGREIVFCLTLPNRVQIRVYTSISRGAESARECGEDAIRLVVGVEALSLQRGRFRPLGKSRKILRTAPRLVGYHNEEDRIVAFLARLRQAVREVYRTARAIPQCPKCNEPMAERASTHGNFWGCTSYPECKGTRPRPVTGGPT